MVGIKKIYKSIKSFIIRHGTLAKIIIIAIVITCCIGAIYSLGNLLLFVCFTSSLAAMLRLTTYKHGKIPIFMFDRTWNSYKLKYSEEESEDKYREMSANRATVYFIIAVIAFIIWIALALLTYSPETL